MLGRGAAAQAAAAHEIASRRAAAAAPRGARRRRDSRRPSWSCASGWERTRCRRSCSGRRRSAAPARRDRPRRPRLAPAARSCATTRAAAAARAWAVARWQRGGPAPGRALHGRRARAAGTRAGRRRLPAAARRRPARARRRARRRRRRRARRRHGPPHAARSWTRELDAAAARACELAARLRGGELVRDAGDVLAGRLRLPGHLPGGRTSERGGRGGRVHRRAARGDRASRRAAADRQRRQRQDVGDGRALRARPRARSEVDVASDPRDHVHREGRRRAEGARARPLRGSSATTSARARPRAPGSPRSTASARGCCARTRSRRESTRASRCSTSATRERLAADAFDAALDGPRRRARRAPRSTLIAAYRPAELRDAIVALHGELRSRGQEQPALPPARPADSARRRSALAIARAQAAAELEVARRRQDGRPRPRAASPPARRCWSARSTRRPAPRRGRRRSRCRATASRSTARAARPTARRLKEYADACADAAALPVHALLDATAAGVRPPLRRREAGCLGARLRGPRAAREPPAARPRARCAPATPSASST